MCNECGADLGEFDPGELVPKCDACEKPAATFEWPTKDVLLAVYGAPYNWPVEAA
jgi:hypothetical protein